MEYFAGRSRSALAALSNIIRRAIPEPCIKYGLVAPTPSRHPGNEILDGGDFAASRPD